MAIFVVFVVLFLVIAALEAVYYAALLALFWAAPLVIALAASFAVAGAHPTDPLSPLYTFVAVALAGRFALSGAIAFLRHTANP